MKTQLTIQEKLKDLRVSEKKKKLKEVAEETGISLSSLSNYESNEFKDISPFALVTLAKYYGVSTDYLLGLTEARNHPDVKVAELHLSDDMLELLRSDKINHRLLNEFATHERFKMLMYDMEICVDRIADMRIQNMNSVMEATRQQIIQKYHPEMEDVYTRTLDVVQIGELDYFSRIVHDDIDAILRDIREAHRKDTTTADDGSVPTGNDVKDLLVQTMSAPVEEVIADMLIKQMAIPREEITEEELHAFISLISKAKRKASVANMRGKVIPHGHGNGKRKR